MLNVGQVIDTMRAGLLRMGRCCLGAGFAALVAFAHVQPAFAGHGGGGFHGGGFQSAPMMRDAPRAAMPMQWGGQRGAMGRGSGGYGGAPRGHYGAGPVRVAEQGSWRERQGGRQAERRGGGFDGNPGGNPGGNPYGNGFGGYHGPIHPVSADARQVPHPPADSPVRAGSIREDVARYNEERSTFRPFQRNGGDVPRPPMPAPYRN
ncbi:hypothetical protein [Paraburkholderia tagetis]|uniref:Peptide-binding protein n=1 Tax=Paraburkholderia tagetis TaxID=2913261 RepID=A0A9X1UJN6_9BURK|nr:hypothetical protein [Paraburkholderia tagetis]MCG5077348.1 hypothetical protein [Paraburkholderia tagetis]